MHLNKDNAGNGNEGLRKALKAAVDNGAEFVMFGGDNADTDHLGEAETTADTLHARFVRLVEEAGLPAYYTIGNHDRFYRSEGQPDTLGFKMFEKHYGPTYRSFTQKGVHFVILNALYPQGDDAPYNVGAEQLEWLKADLDTVARETPVIVSIHVPMLSLYYPVVEGSMKAWDMIADTKAVVDLLKEHNTQLVLRDTSTSTSRFRNATCGSSPPAPCLPTGARRFPDDRGRHPAGQGGREQPRHVGIRGLRVGMWRRSK